jgi:hypothetical protein
MDKLPERMTDPAKAPDKKSIALWIGQNNYKRWTDITEFIDSNYPEIFEIKWLYSGKKYGWWLRYKKSKSFCSFIPEKNRFKLLLIFGVEERKKVESVLPELKSHASDDYKNAKTYFDGKWVGIVVDSEKVIKDVERLMKIKRKPKIQAE